jgi:hypothetical protein
MESWTWSHSTLKYSYRLYLTYMLTQWWGIDPIILYSDSPRVVHWLLCNDNLFLALKGQFLRHAKSLYMFINNLICLFILFYFAFLDCQSFLLNYIIHYNESDAESYNYVNLFT